MAKASLLNPIYTATILTAKGLKMDVTPALLNLSITENGEELAAKVEITIINVMVENKWLNQQINVGDKLYIYADTGGGAQEVFRGTIWTDRYNSRKEKELIFTAYDNLIYLQKSKDSRFYAKGKASKSIVGDICDAWGVSYDYQYRNCTHEMQLFRANALADMIITILDDCRKQTGEKWVVRSEKGKALFLKRGTNTTTYNFKADENVLSTTSEETLDGVVTKVIVVTNEDQDKKPAIEAIITGDTAAYGTLQDVVSRTKTTKLSDAKKEANQIIKDSGKPFLTYTLEALDIPWLHKGDKISVSAGDMIGAFYVKSVTHDAHKQAMSLEVER